MRQELVRAKGLEPPHLAILEPKSSASTSSATPAARRTPRRLEPANRGPPLQRSAQKGKRHDRAHRQGNARPRRTVSSSDSKRIDFMPFQQQEAEQFGGRTVPPATPPTINDNA